MKKFFKCLYLTRYYLLFIAISLAILITIEAFLVLPNLGISLWLFILLVISCAILVIVIDGITAAILHALPKKVNDPYRWYFKTYKWEKKFYRFIKIKNWKDKIPELGQVTADFSKTSLKDPNDPEYLYMFLLESCSGELIHKVSCYTGFLVMAIFYKYYLCIGLPIAIINICFNIPSILIQRYNRPKLIALYERRLKLQKKRCIVNK